MRVKFFVGDKIEIGGTRAEITKITVESVYTGTIRYKKATLETLVKVGLVKHIKQRMTCKSYCDCWNSIDRDCELFGDNHPCPRKCPHYLAANSFKDEQ